MSYSKYSGVGCLLIVLPMVLIGQRAQEHVIPLKNWATPLYWQPNQTEREVAAQAIPQKGGAQLVFSSNQVSSNALTFIAITPCRLVDTRGGVFNGISPFSGPSIAPMTTVTFPVQSATEASANTTPAPCGTIPSIALAYSFNLTVVPHAGGGVDYVSLWPAGGTQPFVSTLDDPQGAIISNAAIVPAGTSFGGVSLFNSGPATTDVIIDMNGFFAAPTDMYQNTAVGAGTLASDTTGGAQNTAVGYQALYSNTGDENTANGVQALYNNTSGGGNTASGLQALYSNTTGYDNTATGLAALVFNTTGIYNTADGYQALNGNRTGGSNTASGYQALFSNIAGGFNVADGVQALYFNGDSNYNTASGYQALYNTAQGGYNTAIGSQALYNSYSGTDNTASGYAAIYSNTTGTSNTASGSLALYANTTGNDNTAFGYDALENNTSGTFNIAVGFLAANNVSGVNSNNIHIGNPGAFGDTGVIKIGSAGAQTIAYIAGIYGVNNSGEPVYINSSGQLGTTVSSRRFKEQITDMGDASSKLFQLRPVNFYYKPGYDGGSHLLQYGLIAEEVEKVYPEMVTYDNDGQILSVKYQMLAPMLLNEVQKQNAQLQKQAEQIRGLQGQNATIQSQSEQIHALEDRLAALEALLSAQAPTATRPASSQ